MNLATGCLAASPFRAAPFDGAMLRAQKLVARDYNILPVVLVSAARDALTVEARFLAMWLCHDLHVYPASLILRRFGRSNLTTLKNALARVEARRAADARFQRRVDRLRAALAAGDARAVEGPSAIAEIIAAVAAEHGLRPQQLTSPSQDRPLIAPRWLAMFLARRLTGRRLLEIGLAFRRCAACISGSVAKVATRIAAEPEFAARVARIEAICRTRAGS